MDSCARITEEGFRPKGNSWLSAQWAFELLKVNWCVISGKRSIVVVPEVKILPGLNSISSMLVRSLSVYSTFNSSCWKKSTHKNYQQEKTRYWPLWEHIQTKDLENIFWKYIFTTFCLFHNILSHLHYCKCCVLWHQLTCGNLCSIFVLYRHLNMLWKNRLEDWTYNCHLILDIPAHIKIT